MMNVKELARQLPLERLKPATRQELESALASDLDIQQLRDAARKAVVELIDSGDLVKVVLSSRTGVRQTPCVVRGTNRLVDLGNLLPARTQRTEQARVEPGADHGANDQESGPTDPIFGMLEAMEYAQNLQVGDVRWQESGVVVDRILSLLQDTIPQVMMHAQLYNMDMVAADTSYIIPAPGRADGVLWQQLRKPGQTLWMSDVKELPETLRQKISASLTPEAATAVLPLLSPLDPQLEVGLVFVSVRPHWTRERHLELSRRLANFVSSRWRTQHDVNLRVHTDRLTGIHNRAYYDLQFPLELERASRAGLPLTLVLADLDRFKAINDTYGHPFGDLVLRTVACRLQAMLRRIDQVCRIGGEEFACLLPSTTIGEAREVLSRLVAQPFLVDLPPEMGSRSLPVTMSCGVVCYPEAGTCHSELHRKADSMLYQAKRLGRNRCCLWMPDGRHQLLLPHSSPAESD